MINKINLIIILAYVFVLHSHGYKTDFFSSKYVILIVRTLRYTSKMEILLCQRLTSKRYKIGESS